MLKSNAGMSGALSLRQMVISPYECLLYAFGYAVFLFYVLKESYKYSQNPMFDYIERRDSLGLLYDPADSFWETKIGFVQKMWWIFVLYLVVSKVLRTLFNPLAWSATTGVMGFLAILHIFGWKAIIFFFVLIVINAAPTILVGSRILLWTVHLSTLSYFSSSYYNEGLFLVIAPRNLQNAMYPIVPLFSIRCLIFFDHALRSKKPIATKTNLVIFFHYCFFLPTFVFGPIHSYRNFYKNVFKPIKSKPYDLIFRALRLVMSLLLLRISYYIYYCTILLLPMQIPSIAIFIGCNYLNGLNFYLIYVLLYGVSKVLSACIGIETPEWPRCISHIFSYVEMWKTFDVGLYNFLTEHIYHPLGGSRHGFLWKTVAVSMSFIYVFVYHGFTFNIFIWSFMNFLQLMVEMLLIKCYHSDFARPMVSLLSPAWTRRIFSILASCSFQFSCWGFFFFNVGFKTTCRHISGLNLLELFGIFGLWGFLIAQLSIECHVRGWVNPHKQTKSVQLNDVENIKKKN